MIILLEKAMEEKKKENMNKNIEDDVEKILDNAWENWASRRRCESNHTPEYIKKQKNNT